MLVSAILSAKGGVVVTIGPDASVGEAASKLWDNKIGAMVVLEGDRIAGIISERDIARGVALNPDGVGKLAVREYMTSDVMTCTPDDKLEDLMLTMTNRRFRHLPVVKDGKMIGIVSIGDIVKNLMDEREMEVHELRSYVTGGRG